MFESKIVAGSELKSSRDMPVGPFAGIALALPVSLALWGIIAAAALFWL